jgi:simple sugar transport system substrate-binding protein
MLRLKKKSIMAMFASAALAGTALLVPATSSAAGSEHYTFAMITHAQPGDSFWSYIRKGAEAAAKKDNVKLIYLANPTASKQAQLVQNAIQQHVDGIALTLAFPDAMASAVKQATAAGIPVVGFNSGMNVWKKEGLLMFIGQDETVAGEAVGNRLNKVGAKDVVCLDQQQGAVQLLARCKGIEKTFKGKTQILYTPGADMAAAQSRMVAKLQQDPKIDYIITLGAPFAPTAHNAIRMAGSHAKLGTFDMSPRALKMIKRGTLQFAVDQQPYLQGYEAVDLLWLYKHNADILGGGKPVLTGPAFVTKQNVAEIAKFAQRGTR